MFGSEWLTANIKVKKIALSGSFCAKSSNEQSAPSRIVDFMQSQRIADAGVYFSC
ncbi:hypothetical protein M8994_12955 [Brucella sp. 21LCYQ03]|nr:hypothetical protein [Brucella sp. 21LCYQ03]